MLTTATALALAASLTGAGATVAAIYFQHDSEARLAGLVALMVGLLLLLGCTLARQIQKVNRPADEAYNDGFDMGYNKGYFEGRRVGSPTVVPIGAKVRGSAV